MGIAFFAVEETAQAEGAGKAAVDRAIEQQVAGLAGAECPVGGDLFVEFTLDAFQMLGIGRDMFLIGQLDVLLGVLAVGDVEGQALAVRELDMIGAGLCRQRDAGDGDPAFTVLADDQQRLITVFGPVSIGLFRQRYHGDAAGYGLVQQTGDEALCLNGQGECGENQ